MNFRLFLPPALLALALFAPAGAARADRNPDFDDDATPILRRQPQLVEYVHRNFEVKDTGQARIPGDDDHPPQPPFIFMARPRHSDGPFFIRLLVQPGPPGRILKVVDMRMVHLPPPVGPGGSFHDFGPTPSPGSVTVGPAPAEPSTQPEPPPQPQPAPASAPAPTQNAPTADTPSGPIPDPSAGASATQDHLAPPPDPAPAQ